MKDIKEEPFLFSGGRRWLSGAQTCKSNHFQEAKTVTKGTNYNREPCSGEKKVLTTPGKK